MQHPHRRFHHIQLHGKYDVWVLKVTRLILDRPTKLALTGITLTQDLNTQMVYAKPSLSKIPRIHMKVNITKSASSRSQIGITMKCLFL